MIADYLDRKVVDGYVGAVRAKIEAGDLDEHAARAAYTIGLGASQPRESMLAVMPEDSGPASSGEAGINSPFFSRDPTVSLLQTSLEDESRKRGIVHEPEHKRHRFGHIVAAIESIVHEVAQFLHPEKFGTHDPEWVTRIGQATLERLAKGNHPFNDAPADYAIEEDDARVVIVGDWGSGLPRAVDVARQMAAEVADAIAGGRAVHVIHLGDVYYSGDPVEYERRLLAPGLWPVTDEQARGGVTSWTLNGNHDMYGGGYGYFETCLGDERFAKQHSPDGKPTSFFRIRTPSWDLVGLDTSWDPQVLSKGLVGVLHGRQADVVKAWAAESSRKLMLLSHHQLLSAYDHNDIGTVLPYKLQSLLQGKRITAWLWGHEHRCMGFTDPEQRIPFMRCIGHGGVPVPATDPKKPLPAPGLWQTSGRFEENDTAWGKFGFAVIDFAGPTATIRYVDDAGQEAHPPEQIG